MHAFHKNVYYMSLQISLFLHSFFSAEYQTDGNAFFVSSTLIRTFVCYNCALFGTDQL